MGNLAVIFGGSGFLGSHLCAFLTAKEFQVVIADLRRPLVTEQSVQYQYCDVREPITIGDEAVPEVVFNLAAVHRTPGHQPHEYYETNVLGALHVAEWCATRNVRTLVFTSSISVYGPNGNRREESSSLAPVSAYGRSKALAEQVNLSWARQGDDRRSIIVRPAVIFGDGEHGNFTRLALALRRGHFVLPAGEEVVKSAIYVRDVVRAMAFLVEHSTERETLANAAFPTGYTLGDICSAFSDVAGYPPPLVIPQKVGRLPLALARRLPLGPLSTFVERAEKLVVGTDVIPTTLIQAGFQWQYTMEQALRDWMASPPVGDFT